MANEFIARKGLISLGDSQITGSNSLAGNYALKVTNTSGADILNVENDGNVGVGIANPTNTLHVNGSAKFNYSNSRHLVIEEGSGADKVNIKFSSNTQNAALTGSNSISLLPDSLLNLRDGLAFYNSISAGVNGRWGSYQPSAPYWQMTTNRPMVFRTNIPDTSTDGFIFENNRLEGTRNLFTVQTFNSNVFSKKFTIARSGETTISGSLTANQGIDVTGAVSASTYYGDGSNLTNIPSDFPYTGSAVISGSLEVIGNTIIDGKLLGPSSVLTIGPNNYKIDQSTGGAGDQKFYLSGGGGWSYNWYTNNTHRVRISDGGLGVGIGNINPDARLHIDGTTKLDGDTTITGSNSLAGNYALKVANTTTDILTVENDKEVRVYNDLQVGVRGDDNGNAGTLTINGDAQAGHNPTFIMDGGWHGSADKLIVEIGDHSNYGPTFKSLQYRFAEINGDKILDLGGGSDLGVTISGNLVNLSGGILGQGMHLRTAENLQTFQHTGFVYDWLEWTGGNSTGQGYTFHTYTHKNLLALNGSTGRVGIGTSSPTAMLHVTGAIYTETNITASGHVSASTYYGDGSNLTNIPSDFPYTGSAVISGSLTITGSTNISANGTNIIEIEKASDFPATLNNDTTYLVRGDITIPNGSEITTTRNNAVIGLDRNKDCITYTGSGTLFTVTGNNFTLSNLKFRASGSTGKILHANDLDPATGATDNQGRTKVLNIEQCEFRNSSGIMLVEGFELVDISNTLCWYNTGNTGLQFQAVRHLEISSCEFYNWYVENPGGSPSGYSTARMVELLQTTGSANVGFGVVNIGTNIFHPEQTQFGLYIDPSSTTAFGTIAANTFIDVGITTGANLGGSNYDSGSMLSYDVGINEGIQDSSAEIFVTVTGNNTTTSLGRGNSVQVDFGGNEIVRSIQRFDLNTIDETIVYTGKKDIKILIAGTLSGEKSGGGSETYTLDLRKDSGGGFVTIGGSSTTFTTSGGTASVTKNLIIDVSQNDELAFFISSAGGDDFTAEDLQLTITQI